MERILNYFRANPAGNITGFVLGDVEKSEKSLIARAIIEQIDSTVEQVGFISENQDGKLRMDMMGGEFCGNATRSFGLFVAILNELKGENKLLLSVSGTDKDIEVITNSEEMTSEVTLNKAKKIAYLNLVGNEYFTVFLDGIIHVIVPDRKADKVFVIQLINELQKTYKEDAYGCLFLDEERMYMEPYVYVPETETLIKEGSCGSGTVASGYYLNKDKRRDFKEEIFQPGGSIVVRAKEENGQLVYSIGGQIEFGRLEEITLEI